MALNNFFNRKEISKQLTLINCLLLFAVFNVSAQDQEPAFYRQGYTVPLFSYNANRISKQERTTSLTAAIKTGATSLIFDFQLTQPDGLIGNTIEWQHNIERLMDQVKLAKSLGIHTVVKPLIMIAGKGTNWQKIKPSNTDIWFQEYGNKILEVLNRKEAKYIDAIIIGNELHSMSGKPELKDDWENLISDIREVFKGEVGYNAGAFLGYFKKTKEEFTHVSFVSSLDFIGFSSYPRLIKHNEGIDPKKSGYKEYYAGWSNAKFGRNYKQEVIDFITDHPDQDVYFTELGSPASAGGVVNFGSNEYNLDLQASFYKASFDVLKTIKGLKGIYVYMWRSNTMGPGFDPDSGSYVWNIYGKPAVMAAVKEGFSRKDTTLTKEILSPKN